MLQDNFQNYAVLFVLLFLQGCAAVAVTGIATSASVAIDKRTTGTIIEDQSIELKAAKALYNDKELNEKTHFNFTSYNTYVLVTGEAPNETLRERAVEMVRNIDKVTHVYNEITIAAPSSLILRISDSLITSKVKAKLLADKEVKGLEVKVVTEKGVVYLMGLSTRNQADRATEVARQTGGVQKVVKLFQFID